MRLYVGCPCCGELHVDVTDLHEAQKRTEAQAARLREALTKLVNRIDVVCNTPEYESVWIVGQLHLGPYRGETWIAEMEAARQALAAGEDKTND